MITLEVGELIIPSSGALEQVSRHNPNLKELVILLDIYELGDQVIPHGYVSMHGLEKLAIHAWIDEETAITTEDSLHMARYLDRLFPSLNAYGGVEEEGHVGLGDLYEIERTLSFCQEIRVQAVDDAQLTAS